jgi:hypothetical protein
MGAQVEPLCNNSIIFTISIGPYLTISYPRPMLNMLNIIFITEIISNYLTSFPRLFFCCTLHSTVLRFNIVSNQNLDLKKKGKNNALDTAYTFI